VKSRTGIKRRDSKNGIRKAGLEKRGSKPGMTR